VDADGTELRSIDLRYQGVEETQCERFRTLQMVGGPVVAIISAAMPLLHAAALFVAPLLAVAHLLILRLVLVRDANRLLEPARRRFNRWLARFAFLWIGLPGYALTATPLAGIVFGAGTYLLLNTAIHGYARWSLRREHLRQPLATWETLLLVTLAVATLLLALVLIGVTALLGWSVAALVEWLASL
jgi:hypothetical protein